MRRLLLVVAFIAAAALGVARAQMIVQDGQPFVPKASGGGGVTWTLENSAQQAGSGSSASTSISSFSGTSANLLVVGVDDYEVNTLGSVATTSPTNSLTQGPTVELTGGVRCTLFYILNPSVGSSMTITYTAGSGSDAYAGMVAEAWKSSGGTGSGSYDQHNSNSTSSQVTTLGSGSITPSVDNELIVSVFGGNLAGTLNSPSINTGTIDETFLASGSTYGVTEAYYKDQATSAFDSTASWTSATAACAVVASFEAHS
jgi:hypothetical protein